MKRILAVAGAALVLTLQGPTMGALAGGLDSFNTIQAQPVEEETVAFVEPHWFHIHFETDPRYMRDYCKYHHCVQA